MQTWSSILANENHLAEQDEESGQRSKRILAIDDDYELLAEISEILSLEGYTVTTIAYQGGPIVARQILETKPDLILLDLKMNGLNGLQLAAELSAEPECSYIPIVIMTGYYTPSEIDRFRSLPWIRACLSKPFKPEEFVREIKKHA